MDSVELERMLQNITRDVDTAREAVENIRCDDVFIHPQGPRSCAGQSFVLGTARVYARETIENIRARGGGVCLSAPARHPCDDHPVVL
jgi:hypothetical protein